MSLPPMPPPPPSPLAAPKALADLKVGDEVAIVNIGHRARIAKVERVTSLGNLVVNSDHYDPMHRPWGLRHLEIPTERHRVEDAQSRAEVALRRVSRRVDLMDLPSLARLISVLEAIEAETKESD